MIPFRGRKVAAPLKHHVQPAARPAAGAFRGRKVAAPLKPTRTAGGRRRGRAFRGRKVAAPLKLREPHIVFGLGYALPRPKGRGPIEARPLAAAILLGMAPSAAERSRPH